MNCMEQKRKREQRRTRLNEAATALGTVGIVILFVAMISVTRVGIIVGNVVIFALAALFIEASIFVGAILDNDKRRLG